MILNRESRLYRLFKDDRGQMLPMMSILLIGFLGTAALSIDLGRAWYGYRELQSSSNAAALAGAHILPNSGAAAKATAYSSLSGDLNAQANMANVTMVSGYPKLECLTSLSNQGMSCVAPASANAVQVQQQMVVNLFFAPIFGKKTLTLTATATAAMAGAATAPYNVAIVVDTTASMNTADTDCGSNTRVQCALAGVQVFLHDLFPCAQNEATCGTVTNGNVADSVDRVSMFVFPNPTLGTVADAYTCPSSNPTTKPYTFPSAAATSYAPSGSTTPTYQLVGYSSDYRVSDTASALATTSDLVVAAGGKSGCNGLGAPGGEGTYIAGAIYAAQASLDAAKLANPGSVNVMIILSDGDAGATSTAMPGASTTTGTYPSTKQQCAQQITAAQAAGTAGTKVYTVAYGSPSTGCSSDTSPTMSPCTAMENMASNASYFFSDYTQSGSGSTCQSAAQPTSNLNQIFTDIAGSLSVPRLIPNGTT
jgi:hypothetical protein